MNDRETIARDRKIKALLRVLDDDFKRLRQPLTIGDLVRVRWQELADRADVRLPSPKTIAQLTEHVRLGKFGFHPETAKCRECGAPEPTGFGWCQPCWDEERALMAGLRETRETFEP